MLGSYHAQVLRRSAWDSAVLTELPGTLQALYLQDLDLEPCSFSGCSLPALSCLILRRCGADERAIAARLQTEHPRLVCRVTSPGFEKYDISFLSSRDEDSKDRVWASIKREASRRSFWGERFTPLGLMDVHGGHRDFKSPYALTKVATEPF